MFKVQFLLVFIGICLFSIPLNGQENNINYNDTVTKKFFELKKDYSKRIFESTFYTIQIYYGGLEEADSILEDFRENYKEIKSDLIFFNWLLTDASRNILSILNFAPPIKDESTSNVSSASLFK